MLPSRIYDDQILNSAANILKRFLVHNASSLNSNSAVFVTFIYIFYYILKIGKIFYQIKIRKKSTFVVFSFKPSFQQF